MIEPMHERDRDDAIDLLGRLPSPQAIATELDRLAEIERKALALVEQLVEDDVREQLEASDEAMRRILSLAKTLNIETGLLTY